MPFYLQLVFQSYLTLQLYLDFLGFLLQSRIFDFLFSRTSIVQVLTLAKECAIINKYRPYLGAFKIVTFILTYDNINPLPLILISFFLTFLILSCFAFTIAQSWQRSNFQLKSISAFSMHLLNTILLLSEPRAFQTFLENFKWCLVITLPSCPV